MKMIIVLLAVFALFFSACAAPNASPSTEAYAPPSALAPQPTQVPIQTEPVPANNSPEMKTYTDDFAGFSLAYPANWFLESSALIHAQESIGYNISVASWDILNPPPPSGKNPNALPEGGTKIDVAVLKQPMTLEEAVTQQSQNETGGPILTRKDVTLAGGLPAVILDFEGFAGPIGTLISVLNGNVIYVSGYGNLENFESIALTLRAK